MKRAKLPESSDSREYLNEFEVPEGWISTSVGDLFHIVGGGTPSTKNPDNWEGDIPWISSADIYGLKKIVPRRNINKTAIENSAAHLVPKGSIIVVTRVSLGRIAICETPLSFSQDCHALIPKTNAVDPEFALYYLSQAVQSFKSQSRGTTISGVTVKVVSSLPFPLPPLAEQKHIVARVEALLTQVNAARDRLSRVPLIMKRFRQAVLAAACSGRLTEGWREEHHDEVQFPTLDDLLSKRKLFWENRNAIDNSIEQRKTNKKYKEPNETIEDYEEDLPLGWLPVTISQIAFLDVGFSFSSKNFQDSGIRLLRGENIEPGSLRWLETKCWPGDQAEEYHHLLLEKGEIVLGMDRPLISTGLKVARVKEEDLPCLLVQRVTRFKMFEPDYTDLLYYNLLTEKFQKHLREKGLTGSALPHITGSAVAEFTLALPPLAEQHEIVHRVNALFGRADQIEQQVVAATKRTEALTQAVLGKAFRGELVSKER